MEQDQDGLGTGLVLHESIVDLVVLISEGRLFGVLFLVAEGRRAWKLLGLINFADI